MKGHELIHRAREIVFTRDPRPVWLRELVGDGSDLYLFLFEVARQLRPRRVLEIGTCLGTSACHLAAGCDETEVWTVDINPAAARHVERVTSGEGRVVRDRIHAITCDSREARPLVQPHAPFDLIFIDGAHDRINARADYDEYRGLAAPDAPILFDDLFLTPDMTAVWLSIEEPKAELLGMHGYGVNRASIGVVWDFQVRR